jgi:hypothetical protein
MNPPLGRLAGSLVLTFLSVLPLVAQAKAPTPLGLGAGDVVAEARSDGYHLFIRQQPGAASVLLSEAFELPDHKLATYAFRSVGPNPVNDGEKRLLDGKFLPQPHHSLVSSTPQDYPGLGKAFEVLLPKTVEYGYPNFPNSRYGKVDVQAVLATPNQPLWFSIRVFAKPYADYTGAYHDNAFDLKTFLAQVTKPTADHYEEGLVEGFSRLGHSYQSKGIDDALGYLKQVIDRPGDSLDLVLVVDTTKSMALNLKTVKAHLLGPIRDEVKKYKSFRIGLVFYRDYMEDYLTRAFAFTSDLDQVQRDLDAQAADGGGDIPEAVVEALWAGINNFPWKADNRVVLLMGDAPQHPTPRGSITEAAMRQKADELKVELQLIMLPQTIY